MRLSFLLMVVGILTACGQPTQSRLKSQAGTANSTLVNSSDGQGADATAADAGTAPGSSAVSPTDAASPPPATTCASGRQRFSPVAGSTVEWVVVKGDGSPVVGTHQVSGSAELETSAPFTDPSLQLDFSLGSDYTGHALRDTRLTSYFFSAGGSSLLRFTLDAATPPAGVTSLPDVGMSIPLSLSGTLHVAGVDAPLNIPVVLSALPGDKLRVTEGTQGVSFDLRQDLGVGSVLDTLLALVGASLDNHVSLRFDIVLAGTCE